MEDIAKARGARNFWQKKLDSLYEEYAELGKGVNSGEYEDAVLNRRIAITRECYESDLEVKRAQAEIEACSLTPEQLRRSLIYYSEDY